MDKDKNTFLKGHLPAAFCVFVWGTTFISTKLLLKSFSAYEINIYRVILAYIALWAIKPKFLKFTSVKNELMYFGAAVSGIAVYQVLENLALSFSYASTTGIIIASAPIFTAIAARIFLKEAKLTVRFFIGFVVAMSGIAIANLGGQKIGFDYRGILFGLLAVMLWGMYAVFGKHAQKTGDIVLVTRRYFFYSIIIMIPIYFIFDCRFGFERFKDISNLLNILYLALVASAGCFVCWNMAIKHLGAIRSGIYIYIIPIVTVIFSAIILKEKITWMTCLGMALAIGGVVISARKGDKNDQ